jgi:hypothetical protein
VQRGDGQILLSVLSDRWLTWIFRAVWASLPVVAGPALGAALDGVSGPVQTTAAIGLWAGWALALVGSLVPSTVSLTTVRLLAPAAPVTAVATALAGADAVPVAAAVAASVVAAVLAFTAELGLVFVKGSAYGDEARFPLRPPGPLVLGPLPLAWAVLAAAVAAGPLLLAARVWVAGAVVTVAAAGLLVLLAPRFHQLARRWLVFVPAGLVLHDPMVLAENAMFRRDEVDGLLLAPAGTEALDATGKALGLAVEVRLTGAGGMLVLAGSPRGSKGKAFHARSFLCSPSRPGRALEEAARRNLRLA